MTAVGWASVAAFAGIGLVALALVLSARRRSTAALAVGLAGLVPVAGASTWLLRGWPADAVAERDGLKAEIAAKSDKIKSLESDAANSKRENERQQAEISALKPEIEKPRADARSIAPGLADATREKEVALRALEDAKAATRQREDEIARLQVEGRRLADAQKQAERDATAAGARIAELRLEVEDLKKKLDATTQSAAIAPMTPTASPQQAKTPLDTTAHLKGLLGRRLGTPYYSIERMAETEQVAGLRGEWYVVRLRLAGEPLVFPDRRFRLPEAESAVETSLQHLSADILAPVARSARKLRVFVRGGADSRNVVRDMDRPEISQLAVLPRLAGGRHGAQAIPRDIPSSLGNDDLPGLRADWLRRVLKRVAAAVPLADPIEILDEPPGDERGRTAELVLYVAW